MTAPLSSTTPITLGVQATLTAPSSSLNYGAVVIANHSSYLVTVALGGDQFNLSPYSKDRFDMRVGGGPVQINSQNPEGAPNTLPAYLIAEWYSPGDEPPAVAYPVALTASPYAIAAQVAAAQLAQGVPNVLTTADLGSFALTPGNPVTLDVHAYASVNIAVTAGVGVFSYYFLDVAGNIVGADVVDPFASVTVPVSGSSLQIAAFNGNNVTVRVTASNRSYSQPQTHGGIVSHSEAQLWSTGVRGMTNGTVIAMSERLGVLAQLPSGSCYGYFRCGTTTKGVWSVLSAWSGQYVTIANTDQCTAGAAGDLAFSQLLLFPPSTATLNFTPTATVASGAFAELHLIPSAGG